jgi:hypothetical protein
VESPQETTPDSGQPKSELDAARELHNERTATPVEKSPYVEKLEQDRAAQAPDDAQQAEADSVQRAPQAPAPPQE